MRRLRRLQLRFYSLARACPEDDDSFAGANSNVHSACRTARETESSIYSTEDRYLSLCNPLKFCGGADGESWQVLVEEPTGEDKHTLRSFATAASSPSLLLSFVVPFLRFVAPRPLIVAELHNGCIIFAFDLKHPALDLSIPPLELPGIVSSIRGSIKN
ncbi:hypothetical protein K0M31_010762 [Melipona bicolor]|uniref:Uncharacterized protein n=1 Tax=Melipona bicolor TaxID=60889 RepID=A0AA40KI50_9HYME|nr:hypothetical protein K0M31_010762 [Melipona bicolor]